jgi:hypothetical protein
MITASFNGKPLLMTPNSKEEGKGLNKMSTSSPFSMGNALENAEEEANKRRMRQEKYNSNGGASSLNSGGGGLGF